MIEDIATELKKQDIENLARFTMLDNKLRDVGIAVGEIGSEINELRIYLKNYCQSNGYHVD